MYICLFLCLCVCVGCGVGVGVKISLTRSSADSMGDSILSTVRKAAWAKCYKTFTSITYKTGNMLECLSITGLSGLGKVCGYGLEPT